MRKLKILEHITLDGVIQSGGGPNEDRDGDFTHGGWSVPYAHPAGRDAILAAQGNHFDLLLGRRTYDIWASYWPTAKGPFADSFNTATKYVATHHPQTLPWHPAQPLTSNTAPDVAESVRHLKSTEGPDLLLWGSSTLTSILLAHDLADEVTLITYPVLLGTGKRFFSEASPRSLTLTTSNPLPSGAIINTCRAAGPLKTGSFPKPSA